jgi:hypothetical protein
MNRQEFFADFLNSFLGYHSEKHVNYYAQWSENELVIVDQVKQKCTNQSIYQELEKVIGEYGFEFTDQMVIRAVNASK